jgi:hypothetical protein
MRAAHGRVSMMRNRLGCCRMATNARARKSSIEIKVFDIERAPLSPDILKGQKLTA